MGIDSVASAPALGRGSRDSADMAAWGLPLAGLVVVGFVLRLIRLDASSFWADELFSIVWIRQSYHFLWTEGMAVEPNPPLYYTLLKAWTELVGGHDEASARLLSVLLSTATIPIVGLIGRELGGRRVGLLAAALFALMPVQIYFAQETRTFALLIFFLAAALLGSIRFARAAAEGRKGWGPLALYALAAAGMVYSHVTALVVLAALNLCTLAWTLWFPRSRIAAGRLVAANLAVALAAVPQLLVVLEQIGRPEHSFIEQPNFVRLVGLADTLFVDPSTPWWQFRLASLAAALVMALLGLLVILARPGRLAWTIAVGPAVVFLALALLMGLRAPILLPRTIAWISVPVCVLAALAILSHRPPRVLRGMLVLALAFAIGLGLHGVYFRTPDAKEDWRGLVAELRGRVAPGDLLAIGPSTTSLAEQVYGDLPAEHAKWLPEGVVLHSFLQRKHAGTQMRADDLTRAVADGRRVWLVLWARDWSIHGTEAMQAVHGATPRVESDHAQLVLLSW